jgi:hypothetical protein
VKTHIAILLVLVISFSCKKKTTPSGPAVSTPQPYSEFKSKYTYYDQNGVIGLDSMIRAVIYNMPYNPTSPSFNFVYGGNVTFNDSTLNYSGGIYGCGNPLSACPKVNMRGPIKWDVPGSGTVTPFTYTFMPVYPIYTTGSQLQDTCVKANGITINLSGISNATSVFVSIGGVGKTIMLPSSSVAFSTVDLASLPTNQNLIILIYISNKWTSTQGGILHGFNAVLEYYKYSYLK